MYKDMPPFILLPVERTGLIPNLIVETTEETMSSLGSSVSPKSTLKSPEERDIISGEEAKEAAKAIFMLFLIIFFLLLSLVSA